MPINPGELSTLPADLRMLSLNSVIFYLCLTVALWSAVIMGKKCTVQVSQQKGLLPLSCHSFSCPEVPVTLKQATPTHCSHSVACLFEWMREIFCIVANAFFSFFLSQMFTLQLMLPYSDHPIDLHLAQAAGELNYNNCRKDWSKKMWAIPPPLSCQVNICFLRSTSRVL